MPDPRRLSACGGVAGALARRAEAAHGALTPMEQAAARRLLLRLATGESGGLIRRRCPYPEATSDASARRALDVLAAARLVTVDASGVDVAHESLFSNWPRLNSWLAEDEQGRRLRAHLAPAALDWDQNGRPEPDLYRGVRLDAALAAVGHQIGDQTDEQIGDLTPIERDFLAASTARAEQELQAERARAAKETRARRRLGGLLTAVAATAALAVAASVVAVGQRNTADDNARLAIARQVGAVALADQPLDRSLLLAVSAVKIDENVGTRSDLLAALQRAPAATGIWHGDDDGPIYQLTLGDGDRIAVGSGLAGVSGWDLADSRTPTASGMLRNDFLPLLAGRPGTDEVAVANHGTVGGPTPGIELWDPATQSRSGLQLVGATDQVTSMAWTADGRWLAAAQPNGDVLVWDVEQRTAPPQHIRRHRPSAIQAAVGCACAPPRFPAVVNAGGSNFAVIERTGATQISSPSSDSPLRTFSVGPDATSVTSDRKGSVLAVGRTSGTVSLFSLGDGRSLRTLPGHSGVVNAVEFAPTGDVLASLGDDKLAIVTEVATGRLVARLTGHTEPATAAAFTRDGRALYTASVDGAIIGWDLANLNILGEQLSPPSTDPNRIESMAAGPAGDVAIGYTDGTARLWRRSRSSPVEAKVSTDALIGIAFSPDGRFVATSDAAGVVRILEATSSRVVESIELPGPAHAVAFSPDGRWLAVMDLVISRSSVHLVEVPSWRRVGAPWPVPTDAYRMAWSPDSHHIAVRTGSKGVVFDVGTGADQWRVPLVADGSSGVAWSPDQSIVATGGGTATGIQLLSASDGTPVGGGWRDHPWTNTLDFAPDGSLLASTGNDGTVVLRDLASGQRFGPPLNTSPARESAWAGFDAAGRLVVASKDGGVWRWDISLPHLIRTACAIAGRDLAAEEWADLNTGRPHEAACP
ncbi:MAG: PD40 domain-containing protein [Kineosporiaceae bacterium]|nr:PD40 domain-containing protein [Kineosporiaceae bacterium]